MKRLGLAQIPLMIVLLLMAIAVPIATKLVQQNQENRGKAMDGDGGGGGATPTPKGTVTQQCPDYKKCGSAGGCISYQGPVLPKTATCPKSTCTYDSQCPKPTVAPTSAVPTYAIPTIATNPVPTVGGLTPKSPTPTPKIVLDGILQKAKDSVDGAFNDICAKPVAERQSFCHTHCVNALSGDSTKLIISSACDMACAEGALNYKKCLTVTPTPPYGPKTGPSDFCINKCKLSEETESLILYRKCLDDCASSTGTGTTTTGTGTTTTSTSTCDKSKYKGEQDAGKTVWLHFDDAYTAGCICGGTDYHYVCESGYWACGYGSKVITTCNSQPKCTQCAGKPDAKGKGDADCSGATNINDASIWRSEFISGELGTVTKNSWRADYDCDGKVTINDISIWRANFIKGL